MRRLKIYLGNNELPYRTIMAENKDFTVEQDIISISNLVIAEQTHSANVHICNNEDNGAGFLNHPQIKNTDALITNIPNQFLLIRTADCIPVLIDDSIANVCAAIHSGREGTRKNIVSSTINVLFEVFRCRHENLRIWIGPGICSQHYPVSEDIWHDFVITCHQHGIDTDTSAYCHLNLKDTIYKQLLKCGCLPENISQSEICTFESLHHFSYRRDKTNNRQINIIGYQNG